MKITTKLLVTVIMAVFCCSVGKAQIAYTDTLTGPVTLIYSNNFSGSGSENITNTQANFEAGVLGGSTGTNWVDALGFNDTNSYYANGTVGTAQGDAIVLPFTPLSNVVYTLQATMTFSAYPGTWIGAGFCNYHTILGGSDDRFNTGGVNWALVTESTENVQGEANTTQTANTNGCFSNPLNYPHTLTIILDTTSNKWVDDVIMDGVPCVGATYGGIYHWASNPTIAGVGIDQNVGVNPADFQWNSFQLFANRLAMLQQPVSATVNEGLGFTNTVVVGGAPPFVYQWYTNGGAISWATNAALAIGSVTNGMANSDYYCVVTNAYGAVTSSPVSLVVYTTPQFSTADPVTYTNLMTLFGGTNIDGTNYLGSSPSFSVYASGQQPMTYFWLTNGVAVGGASGTTFSITNIQLNGPTNFTCIASNSLGTATNVWRAQYIPTPTAPYPQQIIADGPVGYWRLDETNDDPNQYNDGEICDDFMSGNNGIYTNTALYQPGYYVTVNGVNITNDPTETSAEFGPYDYTTSDDANSIGTNLDFSASKNAEFTVSVWANGGYGATGNEPVNGGIVVKGYYGTEEFALDDGADSSGHVRFMIRTAGGTLVAASSTFELGGNNSWNHLVGVCDESNGLISLYINGLLTAQATVTPGSGVLPDATAPITIGANPTAITGAGDHQFNGALDDVAIFNKPLSTVQVGQLYQAAGGVIPLSFTAPLPPTNSVWMLSGTNGTNGVLSIPAFALGAPPLGYYWTNVTTAAVMASGYTNLASLNATLIVSNASPSLSGDVLELVVTNATGSTNLFTTLFGYPQPVTIGYANPILYSNIFDGGSWNIAHRSTTQANSLVGGTNSLWVDALGTNDTGSMQGNGVDNSTEPDSWILPFTPEPGFIYTLSGSLTFYGDPGNWVGMGFAQNVPTNAAVGYGRFSDGGSTPPEEGPNGYDWVILTESTGNVQDFGGGGSANQLLSQNGFFTAATPATHTVQVVLNTTGAQWTMAIYVDGTQAGSTFTYTTGNPPIGAFGITQNTLTAPNNLQWNYLALSAVSPSGFPPYLLAPLPPTNSILLTNATITIPATGYATGPWGYYWINNSTVVTSGTTNNTAPESANLSVPSTSLSAGQLDLVLTNAFGTNITGITLVSAVSGTPIPLGYSTTNNMLYLTWPTDHTGWQLQAQTNPASVGLSTNWANDNPSTGTNQVVVPINTTNGTVFYRLIYTP